MRLTLLILASTLLAASALPAQAAEYYKWVDKNGVVQYSRTPPKDQPAQTVKAAAPAARVDPTDPAATPSSDPQTELSKAAALLREQACAAATANLQALRQSAEKVVTRQDPRTGQHVPLSDAQIAAETQTAEQQVAEHCQSE